MARFFGKVGFVNSVEGPGSVWEDNVIEGDYYGDVLNFSSRFTNSDKILDDITLNNRISIVADAFAYENFHLIKYVEYMGARWEVLSVTVERPRLVLSFGGVYNGPKPASDS